MTGLYPWRNRDAEILAGDANLLIREDQPTIAKMMKDAGYATAAIGKWHLGLGKGEIDWNKEITPNPGNIGFDYSYIIAATVDRVPTVYVENGKVPGLDPSDPLYVNYKENFPGEPTALTHPELMRMKWSDGHNCSVVNGIPRIGYQKGGRSAYWNDEEMADVFLEKVKGFVSENKDRPFFLYYGLHQPHVPRTPHPRFAGKSGMGPRGDAVIEADWCVGQLLDYLDETGLSENTIVIFSSDNGPVLDDGYVDGAVELAGNHKPAGGLRGGKYSLFDGGTHIPLFVYWKGHTENTVSDALFNQLDILASIAELTGAQLPDGLDSESHLDVLLGKGDKGRESFVLEAQGRLALRSGDWIMMPPYSGPETNITGNELGNLGEYGLFNLAEDPAQQHNLAADFPQLLDSLKTVFLEETDGYFRLDVEAEPLK